MTATDWSTVHTLYYTHVLKTRWRKFLRRLHIRVPRAENQMAAIVKMTAADRSTPRAKNKMAAILKMTATD